MRACVLATVAATLIVEAISDEGLGFSVAGGTGRLRRVSHIRLVSRTDSDALSHPHQADRDLLGPWEAERSEDYVTAAGQLADVEAALDRHAQGAAAPFVILDDGASRIGSP